MSTFDIIPDTSCDLDAALRERFGIGDYLHGILYYPDGHSETADLDWSLMSPEEYYNSMKGRSALYKTANIPLGHITEVFEKSLKEGKDILSISISTKLSSIYSETVMVAKELLEKYPERKIICVDSKRYSTALALLVIKACQKRDEGASIEETAEYIESIKHKIHQMGTMDDLYFLCKAGRISNSKAFFGSLVGVNPMADFNREGLSEVIIKKKGKRAAFDTAIKYIEQTIENPEEQIIFVAHSNREKQAKIFSEMIKEKFSPKEIIINPVGITCGASIGPGLCAAFYIGKEISEGLADEKAIMESITGENSN